MIETIIIAGVILASAILIYVGLQPGLKQHESREIQIRRMARTLVRSVEQRAQWDATLHSTQLKWARIVLVLKAEFDIDDDWLHIIIGEAQFDMEADNGSNRLKGTGSEAELAGRHSELDARHHSGDGSDSERHPGSLRDRASWGDSESSGGTELGDFGEDLPIPSAG